MVNASGVSPLAGRHSPAKQNQSSPALVNRHFDFGDLAPLNSKKCDAGTRQRPANYEFSRLLSCPGIEETSVRLLRHSEPEGGGVAA